MAEDTKDWNWASEYVENLSFEDVQDNDIMDFLREEMRDEIIRKVPDAATTGVWTQTLDYLINHNKYRLVIDWHR